MEWINSTELAEKRLNTKFNYTVFNYVDKDKESFGSIIVSKSGINWFCANSRGSADSVGQAKRTVEKLVKVTG